MRITAGALRGRIVRVPDVAGVRPTPAKVRQALFNILGDIEGMRILELYAGSGIVALEALSRGASRVVSVERQRQCVARMRAICREWQLAARWRIIQAPVQRALTELADSRFDLVFADPPYGSGQAEALPAWLDRHAIDCRLLVIEESARTNLAWPSGWHETQSRRYGDTCLHFIARGATERSVE